MFIRNVLKLPLPMKEEVVTEQERIENEPGRIEEFSNRLRNF
jgi:hypothetical protein